MQLYNSRKKFLKKGKECEVWAAIDYNYMTEESDGEDGCINQHKLTWRSPGVQYYLSLDRAFLWYFPVGI